MMRLIVMIVRLRCVFGGAFGVIGPGLEQVADQIVHFFTLQLRGRHQGAGAEIYPGEVCLLQEVKGSVRGLQGERKVIVAPDHAGDRLARICHYCGGFLLRGKILLGIDDDRAISRDGCSVSSGRWTAVL